MDPTKDQLDEIYKEFERDFISKPFIFKGYKVKIALDKSKVDGFEKYPETFVHLITRKGNRGRVFDKHRANKIHWIRCILDHHDQQDIVYFEHPGDDENLREYYWFKDFDFLVIMERITPDYIIVTNFHIDDKNRRRHFEERETSYRNKG